MRRVWMGLLTAALLLGNAACGGSSESTVILAIEGNDQIDMGMAPESGIAIRISPAPGKGKQVIVDVEFDAHYQSNMKITPTELDYNEGETEKTIEIRPLAPTNGQFIPVKLSVRDKNAYTRTLQVRITQH